VATLPPVEPRPDDADAADGPWIEPAEGAAPMPRWVLRAVVVFWLGFIATPVGRWLFSRLHTPPLPPRHLVSSRSPSNRASTLPAGWRRGVATAVFLFEILVVSLLFVGAIGALIARQVANFIDDLPSRITEVQDFINRNFSTSLDFGDLINRIDKGKLDGSLASNTISFTTQLLGGLLQVLTVLLLTFYMVADGPRLRRVICRRLRPDRQQRVLHAWELAIDKTGGYLYSRALLALLSAIFHTAAFSVIGLRYPVALAIWVGLVSQFLPVIGTYLAGVLPVLVALLDDPIRALWVLIVIVVYQQIENYLFAPRITARTLELHPAVAFSAAIAGAAMLGPVGALLALPACATVQGFLSEWGPSHDVVESHLTEATARAAADPSSGPGAGEVAAAGRTARGLDRGRHRRGRRRAADTRRAAGPDGAGAR
jgi:predicted PurR-regulated permease PerM